MANKRSADGNEKFDEVDLHDLLLDLGLITLTPEQTALAVSTEGVRLQKNKFKFQIRKQNYLVGRDLDEDVIRNLFKILCAVMNLRLR
jgi:hypothetical protein